MRRGDFKAAVLSLTDGRVRLPAGLEAFFPGRDGRQDLVHRQDFGLARHARVFRAALRSAERGGLPRREKAALTGALNLFLGEYAGARRRLAPAAAREPGDYWLNLLHAMSLWLLGDRLRTRALIPEALVAADRAVQARPRELLPRVLRGGLRREAEDETGAIADAEAALRADPDFVWSRVERLELLGGRGRYREAAADAARLLRLYPRTGWAWAQRARLRGLSGRYLEALADFDRAVKRDPKSGPLRAWRAEALRRLGRYDEALEGLERAIALDPDYRLAWQWRGRIRLLMGDYAGAVRDFDRTLALEPRERLVAAWRGEARWKLGRHRAAAEDFEEAFPAEPHKLWNARLRRGERQESYYMLDAVGGKRLEAFRADVDEGAAGAPRCAWAAAFRGRALAGEGRLEEALAELERALRLSPDMGYALSWKGEALRRLGRAQEALAALDRAAVRARGISRRWAWARLGEVLTSLGREREAAVALERALPPGDQRFALGWMWLAESLRRAGRGEAALEAARRAARLDPKRPEVRDWRARHEPAAAGSLA